MPQVGRDPVISSNSTEAARFFTQPSTFAASSTVAFKRFNQQKVAANQFLSWLQVNKPDVYGLMKIMRKDLITTGPLSGLGDSTDPNSVTDWAAGVTNFLTQVAPAVLQFKSQQSLINANLERAKQGLPPLDASSVTPGVNIGISPQTQQLLMWAGIGALALGGAYIFLKHGRHR
jgi:hypothetical protein